MSYELEGRLGAGGMGEVWAARDTSRGRDVAVKVLLEQRAVDERFARALRHEIRSAAQLDHPHVVAVLDQGSVDTTMAARVGAPVGSPFVVMERVAGPLPMPADFDELARVLLQALWGLAHAHARGLVHRDLKPSNLLVDAQGAVKLCDFGLAHVLDRPDDTLGGAVGTPAYMAPEQFDGALDAQGPWTDIYALACVAYRLVSGDPPHGRSSDAAMMAAAHRYSEPFPLVPRFDVPDGLYDLLLEWLAKEPGHRPQSAPAAARGLSRLMGRAAPSHVSPFRELAPARLPDDSGLGLYGIRPVRFVGRATELDRLERALADTRASQRPTLVLLEGAAGVGKTRLAEHFAARAAEEGRATHARALHSELGAPGDGLVSTLRRGLRVLSDAPVDRVGQALERLELSGDDRRALLRWLTRDLVAARETSGPLLRALLALGGAQPTVLVLDDLQWGEDTLGFVSHVLDAADAPLLLLATVRADARAERPDADSRLTRLAGHERAVEVPVAGLAPDDRARLVRGLLPLEPRLSAELVQRTSGNPLFAVQLVGDWVERGLLVDGPDGLSLREPLEAALPDSLGTLWSERVASLLEARPDDDARALAVAAALGVRVSRAEWERACAHLGVPLSDGLVEDLVAARLARVASDGESVELAHAMLREAIEARARDTEAVHAACAAALTDQDVPGRLGRHLARAGELERSLQPLLDGARRAREGGELDLGTVLLRERSEALERLALPASDARHGWGLIERARNARRRNLAPLMDELSARALAQARAHGWRDVEALALTQRAHFLRFEGKLSDATELLFEALAIAEAAAEPDRRTLATVRNMLSDGLARLGRFEEALPLAEQSEVACRAEDDPLGAGNALYNQALALRRMGRFEETREKLEQMIALQRPAGLRFGVGMAYNSLGEVAREQGRFAEADLAYRESYAVLEAIGAGEALTPYGNRGLLLVEQEAFVEARVVFEQYQRRVAKLAREPMVALSDAVLMAIDLGLGDVESGRERLARVEAFLERSRMLEPVLARMFVLGAGHTDDPSLRATLLAEAHRQYDAMGDETRAAEVREMQSAGG